jgi:UDP-N-acetylmuramoyl-L-alanyl-D-glutamate--2,6-diaminopimelate ligase
MKTLKNLYHYLMAWFGCVFYGNPSRKLYVIGITGTKGKSTTVELLNAVLEAAGKKTAFLSSVHVKIGDMYEKNNTGNTMPGRMFIQQWLRRSADAGCEYAILEVTSQGTVQHRHRFIDFNVAAMTCLHAEHIESHGTFENYRDAKVRFFRDTARRSRKPRKLFFVNSDAGADGKFFSHAVYDEEKRSQLGEVTFYARQDFIADVLGGDPKKLGDWLSSGFNLENAALVHAIAKEQGIADALIVSALAKFRGVPGRMEFFEAETPHSGGPFRVVVDYAHTPGSFEALFSDLRRRLTGKGRLIAVFGSYGEGRDKWKRPELGKVAARYCHEMILANEGPGEENPQEIVDQIASGIPRSATYRIILDRREAIREALKIARAGDIVALVGKGHETYINLGGGKKIAWNERRVAEELLKEL